jgi:hypothetical protein
MSVYDDFGFDVEKFSRYVFDDIHFDIDFARGPQRLLYQIDAWLADPDDDLIGGIRCARRQTSLPVRVQVMAGTHAAEAIRLLRKVADWIENESRVRRDERTDDEILTVMAGVVDR